MYVQLWHYNSSTLTRPRWKLYIPIADACVIIPLRDSVRLNSPMKWCSKRSIVAITFICTTPELLQYACCEIQTQKVFVSSISKQRLKQQNTLKLRCTCKDWVLQTKKPIYFYDSLQDQSHATLLLLQNRQHYIMKYYKITQQLSKEVNKNNVSQNVLWFFIALIQLLYSSTK